MVHLQGSTCVYSRKVEHLVNLVYQALETIINKRQKEKQVSTCTCFSWMLYQHSRLRTTEHTLCHVGVCTILFRYHSTENIMHAAKHDGNMVLLPQHADAVVAAAALHTKVNSPVS